MEAAEAEGNQQLQQQSQNVSEKKKGLSDIWFHFTEAVSKQYTIS